jgi:SAM-dependent methyltransferase
MAEARNYNEFLLDLVRADARDGDRIVDFGAGIGTFANQLRAEGFAVECVEPDARQAAMIRRQGGTAYDSLRSISPASVDLVYTMNVLEHIEEDRAVLAEIRSRLRPGGRLIVYVPAFPLLYTSMDRRVGHVRRYRAGDLREKVIAAGFALNCCEYVDSVGFVATLAYKALGDSSGQVNRRALRLFDRFLFPVSRIGDSLGFKHLLGKNLLVRASVS